eukprot:Opistho-2@7958
MSNRVRVVVRTRPTANFAQDKIRLSPEAKSINIHIDKKDQGFINNQQLDWNFKVDNILHNASQEAIYDDCARSIVVKTLDGFNGTIMAYGQTGAGKTFTMTGATENYKHRGLIPRAIAQIFREVSARPESAVTVRISYLEIYNEQFIDLLSTLADPDASGQQLMVTDNADGGTFVKGLTTRIANNEEEALNLLFEGETTRAISEHSLNKQSSRSHCVFTIHIESRSRIESSEKFTVSKLNLVDLAGSERLSKTQSDGTTLREAMYINKSLSFLEQVIIALADRRRDHVPYRQSKLTHVLKDALGGNCDTIMIANIWGESTQLEETISTLRFSQRMMCVANAPVVNVQYDPAMLVRKYEREIKDLKQELAMHDTLASRSHVSYEPYSDMQRYELQKIIKKYLAGEVDDIEVVNLRQIKELFAQFRTVVRNMEGEVEEKLRSKYLIRDREQEKLTTEESTAAAVNAGSVSGNGAVDDGGGVGDVEGGGFGVGIAPASAKPTSSQQPAGSKGAAKKDVRGKTKPPEKEKEKEKEKSSVRSPTPDMKGQQEQNNRAMAAQQQQAQGGPVPQAAASSRDQANPAEKGLAASSGSAAVPDKADKGAGGKTALVSASQSVLQQQAPQLTKQHSSLGTKERVPLGALSTLPEVTATFGKNEAFEDFKTERGSEINRILLENKAVLKEKKRIGRDLSTSVNIAKKDIDDLKNAIQRHKDAAGQPPGEDIIDEEEFSMLRRLRDLKQKYRTDYEELRAVRSDIEYCQRLVDQCRHKLMTEFETWYHQVLMGEPPGRSNMGSASMGGMKSPDRGMEDVLDDQERFDRLQMEKLMNEEPDAIAFYKARKNNERKTMVSMTPKKKPTPVVAKTIVKNRPPTMLTVT